MPFALTAGQFLASLVLGEVAGAVVRSSGMARLGPHESVPRVAVAGSGYPHTAKIGTSMSFDIVGSNDYGSIGYEELIGAMGDDDFLDALVQGSVSDLLISGDGSSEIIGATAAAKRAASAKKQAALKALAMKNAGAVVSRGLDRRRRYPLGFVPTAVAAATSVQVPSAPQNLYRPERLVIPSDIAFDAGVADIKVGNQSQLVQSVEVPAALFSEVAINTGVTFDTAEVGNQVSVTIRNKSAAAFEFTAGLVGTIAK
jgi:hypothetical protein